MTRTTVYGIRLAVALAAVALATMACQSLLDFDSLKAKTPGLDAKVREGGGDLVQPKDRPKLPDTGKCKSGEACGVPGQKGECAKGVATCPEAGGDGTCKQVNSPTKEACDSKDSDCDGASDENDADACAGENYCKPGAVASCVFGCATAANCSNGNTVCEAHGCKCGASGPRCSGGFQCDATAKACRCGSKKLACGSNESCDSAGACACGSTTATDGPACKAPQACLGGGSSKACGTKSDAGPDKGPPPPDKGPDKSTIDQKLIDQKLIDQKLIDQQLIDQKLIDQQLIDQQLIDQKLIDAPQT